MKQFQNSIILLIGTYSTKFLRFIRQAIIAYYIGVSYNLDQFYFLQMVPLVLTAVFGGAAGEVAISFFSKPTKSKDKYSIALFYLLFLVLLGLIYFMVSYYIIDYNGKKQLRSSFFESLTVIFILNFIVSSFLTFLSSFLFIAHKFKHWVIIIFISEILGLISLVFLIQKYSTYSIAVSLFVTSLTGTLLVILILFKKQHFRMFSRETVRNFTLPLEFFKKSGLVSLNTLIVHLATILDRSITYNFLESGYLSGLQYAKNVNGLATTAFLSSINKIIYVKQSNLNSSDNGFIEYSKKMYLLILHISFVMQIVFIFFTPFLIALFFRRGHFTNQDLILTNGILLILNMALVPEVMLSFINRTFYALGDFKSSIRLSLFRIGLKVIILLLLFNSYENFVPISTMVSFYGCLIFSVYYLYKKWHIQLITIKNSIIFLLYIVVSAIIIILLNPQILKLVENIDNQGIYLIFGVILILLTLLIYIFLKNKERVYKLMNYKF